MPPHGIPSEICLLMKFLGMVYLLMVGIPGDCTLYSILPHGIPDDGMSTHSIPCYELPPHGIPTS